jgi:hypothetical protein
MAIFNLTDILFSQSGNPATQALEDESPLDKSFGKYSITRYPIELGSDPDRMHYVIFHINTQKNTQYASQTVSDPTRAYQNRAYLNSLRGNITPVGTINSGIRAAGNAVGAAGNFFQQNYPNASRFVSNSAQTIGNLGSRAGNALSSAAGAVGGFIRRDPTGAAVLDAASAGVDAGKQIFTKIGDEAVKNLSEENFLRTTQRTVDTIALYMPNALQYNLSQSWNSENLADITGGAGMALAGLEQLGKEGGNANMTPFLGALAEKLGGGIMKTVGVDPGKTSKVLQAAFGYANNPQIEMIYERPTLRTFSFSFAFYPRSRSEAQQVQKIIRLFRFHSAPEIAKNFGGRFLIPPSNFDIMFCYNGKENPNVPKVSTCVLTSVGVQYSTGSNYEIPSGNSVEDPTLGGTGMPHQITLSLSFSEIEVITKELIDLGQNNQGGY